MNGMMTLMRLGFIKRNKWKNKNRGSGISNL